jgi:hypothetical protein
MAIHIHIHNENAGGQAIAAARSVPAKTAAMRAKFEKATAWLSSFTKPKKKPEKEPE